VYKWVPVITGEVAYDAPASHPWGVMLLVAYCYRISSGSDETFIDSGKQFRNSSMAARWPSWKKNKVLLLLN
jgi:hypothetical protein